MSSIKRISPNIVGWVYQDGGYVFAWLPFECWRYDRATNYDDLSWYGRHSAAVSGWLQEEGLKPEDLPQ